MQQYSKPTYAHPPRVYVHESVSLCSTIILWIPERAAKGAEDKEEPGLNVIPKKRQFFAGFPQRNKLPNTDEKRLVQVVKIGLLKIPKANRGQELSIKVMTVINRRKYLNKRGNIPNFFYICWCVATLKHLQVSLNPDDSKGRKYGLVCRCVVD